MTKNQFNTLKKQSNKNQAKTQHKQYTKNMCFSKEKTANQQAKKTNIQKNQTNT